MTIRLPNAWLEPYRGAPRIPGRRSTGSTFQKE